MEEHVVKVLAIEPVTHDVRRYTVEKPQAYRFIPGQATEVSLNRDGWQNERRPFTFTSLNEWDHLEFTIKSYNDHDGVTHQLGQAKPGDEILLHDVWGAIQYKGPGVFIAGGAGVTPFIAILRQLRQDGKLEGNRLIFSNKTIRDIILKEEFEEMLGNRFVNTLTEESAPGYDNRRIDREYLKDNINDFSTHFYICGPDAMVQAVKDDLTALGASQDVITVEL